MGCSIYYQNAQGRSLEGLQSTFMTSTLRPQVQNSEHPKQAFLWLPLYIPAVRPVLEAVQFLQPALES
nr:MAG TPA: hypothetical protein [Caudoviricetes sp.]